MGWRYYAGLGLIGAFVLIWVSSAEITQRIFVEYKQPFALTYLGVSVMVIYFLISVFRKWICSLLKILFRNFHEDYALVSISTGLDAPFRIDGILLRPETDLKSSLITDKEIREREEGMPLDKKEEDEPSLLARSYESSSWKIAKCGLYLTPIWFAQEYFSNMALANTSVTSTTVLSSMSGLFTLFFGAILGQDSVNITKIAAVLISMAGVVMTTVGKTWAADEQISVSETQKHSIIGDIFGLLSAICYGLFTVLLNNSAGSGDKVDMQKLFGCIGLYSFLGFWWLGMDYFLGNFAQ
ncbi:membrane protein [Spatholobus suberectus]|nr:membrane protein [Spatholobus suberectus]